MMRLKKNENVLIQTTPLFFYEKILILLFMSKNYLYIMMPLFLTGCIGSWISGHTEHLCEDYPNILTVPERPEACRPRGHHAGDEKLSRIIDFITLEEAGEEIRARDEALREGRFPDSQPEIEETEIILDDKDAPEESVELDTIAP